MYTRGKSGRGNEARDRFEPLARGVPPMPYHQLPFDISNLGDQALEVTRQSHERGPRNLG